MSKRVNVNPDHYKVGGRLHQGDETVQKFHKQRLTQAKDDLAGRAEQRNASIESMLERAAEARGDTGGKGAKKAAAKKGGAKKAAAKTGAAKQGGAKKAAVKKGGAKKSTAAKAASKKGTAKKGSAKKSGAKKSGATRTPSSRKASPGAKKAARKK